MQARPAPFESLPDAVIFDWDNTLIDSWEVIHQAMNDTFAAMGLPGWTMEEIRARVGLSMRDSFPALFGDRWQEAGAVFTERFSALHLAALRPLPGAGRLLDKLHQLGIALAVVSNKRGPFLRAEAAHLGWDRYFHRLTGAADAVRDKPDAAPVQLALSGLSLPARPRLWFVGDADVDMRCGLAAGCVPVLLDTAGHPPESFADCPPAMVLRDCSHLFDLICELSVCNPAK